MATSLSNLALVVRNLGELPTARAHLERALKLFRNFLRDDNPITRIVRGNLEALDS